MNMLSDKDEIRIQDYIRFLKENSKCSIGYPGATDYDFSELFPLLDVTINNVGDPKVESSYELNSRSFENEVLQFFAELFRAPKNNWWGYVTNGGSEGNLYGLYLARELFSNAIVYYSEATHYSVQKNIHILGIQSIVIRTYSNGEIDYDDLRDMIQMHRDQPVIVMANIGTTMTEAQDDLTKIKAIFKSLAIKNHYIHCDAALAGVYSALLNDDPKFDFINGCDSIAISGHKFMGSPIPSGVVLVKKSYKDRIGKIIPYIGSADTTISGSRNGHSPIFLWYTIKRFGKEGLKKRAQDGIDLAAYTVHRLQELGIDAWSNPGALTVVFPQAPDIIKNKWQLATEGGISHIICMPGVTKEKIDGFLDDLILHLNQDEIDITEQVNL
jgi:histidine decarboxylase